METSVMNGPDAARLRIPAVPVRSCAICDAPISRWRAKDTPVGRFAIDRCVACGFAFVNPRPGLDFLMRFYATSGHRRDAPDAGASLESVLQSEAEFPNSTLDARRMVQTIRSLLPERAMRTAAFLDVGCGYGFYAREAVATGFKVAAKIRQGNHDQTVVAQQAIGLGQPCLHVQRMLQNLAHQNDRKLS